MLHAEVTDLKLCSAHKMSLRTLPSADLDRRPDLKSNTPTTELFVLLYGKCEISRLNLRIFPCSSIDAVHRGPSNLLRNDFLGLEILHQALMVQNCSIKILDRPASSQNGFSQLSERKTLSYLISNTDGLVIWTLMVSLLSQQVVIFY